MLTDGRTVGSADCGSQQAVARDYCKAGGENVSFADGCVVRAVLIALVAVCLLGNRVVV
jgi:hypothetical protein